MYFSQLHPVFFSAVFTSSVLAAPSEFGSKVEQRQDSAPCSPARIFDATCWTSLKIPEYLTQWATNTPYCDDIGGSGSNCCLRDEAWSTCFLRLAIGAAGFDCTLLSSDSYCNAQSLASPNLSEDLPEEIVPQVSYVTLAIYRTHVFLASFYERLRRASPNTLDDIYEAFETSPEGAPSDYEILELSMLQLLGLSMINATGTSDPETSLAASTWVAAYASSPNLTATLVTGNVGNEQQMDITDYPTSGAKSTRELLSFILDSILSSIATFLAVAADGLLSGIDTPQVPTSVDVNIGLNTFVTSKLMQNAGMYAVPGDVIDSLSSTAGCESVSVNSTICVPGNGKVRYRSPSTRRFYELSSKAGNAAPSPQDLVTSITDDGWADMEFLFDGSYNCTFNGRAGREIVAVDDSKEGGLDLSCIGQLPIYLECGTECPEGAVLVGGQCPFGRYRQCG